MAGTNPNPAPRTPPRAGLILGIAAAVVALLVVLVLSRPPAPNSEGANGPIASGSLPANSPAGGGTQANGPSTTGNTPAAANAPAQNGPAGNAPTPSGKPAPVAPATPAPPKVNPSDLPPGHPEISNADPSSQVTVQWLGYSCFYIQSPGGTAIVTDPFNAKDVGLPSPDIGAHLVTVSTETSAHNDVAAVRTFREAGATKEVVHGQPVTHGDVRITPIPTAGGGGAVNYAYVIQAGSLRLAHLGDIRRPLDANQAKALGAIDILMLPVGGDGLSPKDAVQIARQVNPKVVLPMEYATADMEGTAAKLRGLQPFVKASPFAVTPKEYDVMLISKPELPPSTEIWTLKFRR